MSSTAVLVPIKLWNKTALLNRGLISSTPLVQVETNEELIELWLANKKSRHTHRAYQQDIDYFLGFIENKPLPLVTGNDLIAYKQALERSLNQKKATETISPNTVSRPKSFAIGKADQVCTGSKALKKCIAQYIFTWYSRKALDK